MPTALQQLLNAARSLPGERDPVPPPILHPCALEDQPVSIDEQALLCRDLGVLLRDLADRSEPALTNALVHATQAWDQADALTLMDDGLRERASTLMRKWRVVANARSGCVETQARARAVEALLVLETAVALLELLERRLAALIRLRLGAGGDLLPQGRPFLDIPAALCQVARGWT